MRSLLTNARAAFGGIGGGLSSGFGILRGLTTGALREAAVPRAIPALRGLRNEGLPNLPG